MKLKRVSRAVALTFLILVLSLSQLPSQVPSVFAHENVHVHPYMCEEAAKLLPAGSAMCNEISSYMGSLTYDSQSQTYSGWGIKFGAYYEDEYDYIYPDVTFQFPGIVSSTHFWDADKGPDDLVKPIILPTPFGTVIFGPFPNAYQKSLRLFQMALNTYSQGISSRKTAYQYLGHVAHLLEDMTVPAHVHEDFHPNEPIKGLIPGGDDCYECWYYDSGVYTQWGADQVGGVGAEKLITFPPDVEAETRQGNWSAGLYYLMYTTNQMADYFASDDERGDTDDPEGWMDYPSDWWDGPRTMARLDDNDDAQLFGNSLGEAFSNDNNDDGDLSFIASKTVPYGLRAVATLYKMFYEATHPPGASISIYYADANEDGLSDYRNVRLDLGYNVGADEYFQDLEAWYGNAPPDPATQRWERIGAVPDTHAKQWVLSEGNGTKRVYYQVRNLMGRTTTAWDTVDLGEIGVPQTFGFHFTATGEVGIAAWVDFYLKYIQVFTESGDGNVEFYMPYRVDNGAEGGNLWPDTVLPDRDLYFETGPNVNYGYGNGIIPLEACTTQMMDAMGWTGWVGTDDPFDRSRIASVRVPLDTYVRLRTHGWDYDPWPNPDDDLGNVWVPSIHVPEDLPAGESILADWYWYQMRSSGLPNSYYRIYVQVNATRVSNPWSDVEYNVTDGKPYTGAILYGEEPGWVQNSALGPPADYWYGYIDPIHSKLSVLPNPAVGCAMWEDGPGTGNGPELWAWTVDPYPDMVIVGLSPAIYLCITDPDGCKVGTRGAWFTDESNVTSYVIESFDQIPGASVSRIDANGYFDAQGLGTLNGGGGLDTVVVFDHRKPGTYMVEVTERPEWSSYNCSTYFIGVNTYGQRKVLPPQEPPPPRQFEFLVEDAEPLESYVVGSYVFESTDLGANLPPTADAGGPYRGHEGAAVTLDAGDSTDPDGDSLTYRWDFDSDGTWDTTWSSSPTASHAWPDDWTGTGTVEVSDGTFTDTANATVTISNVVPTVVAGPNQLAAPGELVHFSGSVTDPAGLLDPYTVVWHFGDGFTATGTLTPTHWYTAAGKYSVNLTVTDDDGGVGVDALTVTTGVDVTIAPLEACIPPSESGTYSVLIHHLGTTEDTYDLILGGLDPAWYSLSATSVTLSSDQTDTVTLTVSPPDTAPVTTYGFTVRATSKTNPAVFGPGDADVIVFTVVPEGPREDDLVITYYSSQEAAYAALTAGEIDFIGGPGYSPSLFPAGSPDAGGFLTGAQADNAFTNLNIATARVRAFNMYQFDLNNNYTIPDYPDWRSPMSYTTMRQAVAFLSNKDYYVNTLLGGKAERIDQPLPASLSGWGDPAPYPYEYDPLDAQAVLDSTFPQGTTPNPDYDLGFPGSAQYLRTYPAGHEKAGQDLDPLKIMVRSDHTAQLYAGRAVYQALRKHGVPCNVTEAPNEVLHSIVMSDCNYHLYTGAWTTWKFPTHVYPLYHSSFAPCNMTAGYEQWDEFWSLGDVNRDGHINQADADLITLWFGAPVPPAPPECDLNGDAVVNMVDLAICASNYGSDIWTYFGLRVHAGGQNYVTGSGTHLQLDQYLEDFYYAEEFGDSVAACAVAMGEFTRECVTVPLWSDHSYCAWNKNLLATVNMQGYGIVNPYTFMNMYKMPTPYDPDPIIRCGIVSPTVMNAMHACTLYSGFDTPPYNLAVDQPGFVTDWETSTWNDTSTIPSGENKTLVRMTLRSDGYFAKPLSGNLSEHVNAGHFFWNAWLAYQVGDGWFSTSFKDLHHIDMTGPYSFDIYFDTLSYWNTYAGTGPLRPMSTYAQDPTLVGQSVEALINPTTPGTIDLANDAIWINYVTFNGGPLTMFTDYNIVRGDLYLYNDPLGGGTLEVSYQYSLAKTLHDQPQGNLPSQPLLEGAGMYYITSITTGASTFKHNPFYYMETPLLGDVDFVRKSASAYPGAYKVDIYDLYFAAAAFGSQGTGVPSLNWFPGADLAPDSGVIDIYDVSTVTGINYDQYYDPPQ